MPRLEHRLSVKALRDNALPPFGNQTSLPSPFTGTGRISTPETAASRALRLAAGILILCLAACAPAVPREALQQTNVAYGAVVAASSPLLTDLAAAERRNFTARPGADRSVLREGDRSALLDFRPAEAGLRGSVGYPPLTASVRRGLEVVGDYLKLLTLLAEGGNIQEAQAQIRVLADSVAGLAAVATSGAALAVVPVVGALEPLIRRWAEASNAEELRRLVLQGEGPVDALLSELIKASSTMYDVLIARPRRVATTGEAAARSAAIGEMNDYGLEVADYVLRLQSVRKQLAALAAAVRAPGSAISLASLSGGAEQLLIDARATRRAAELLRAAGRTP